MNQTKEQIAFRAKIWQEFVAQYQAVMITAPDTFSAICAEFRARWIAGR
jgi:hypothetical protein